MEEIIEYLKANIFDNSYFKMVLAGCIILATILIRMIAVRILNKFINHSTLMVKNDPTNYTFLKHAISALIYIIGFSIAIYTIPTLRSLANSLLAGAGILAVAIGFASQQAFSNIISGIFIIIFKPFRVNDRLNIQNNVSGIVEDITLRHTVIRNYENRRVIIPNSIISNETLINSDIVEEKVCKIIEMGISYSSDIKLAREIIQKEALAHPDCIDNRTEIEKREGEPIVRVMVKNWGDSSINLKIWIWANDSAKAYLMGGDLYESIKEAFDANGIEIPFPYRTIVYKTDIDKSMRADSNKS